MKIDQIVPAQEKEPPPKDSGVNFLDVLFKKPVVGAVEGLNAGIGQARDERAASREKTGIKGLILNLEVTGLLQEQLQPRLEAYGWRLANREAKHPYGGPNYKYTSLQQDGMEIALSQVPPDVFAIDENNDPLHDSHFAKMLKAFRKKRMRLFSKGVQGMTFTFRTALEDERQEADWRFVPWLDVIAVSAAKLEFWQAFALGEPDPASPYAYAQPKRANNIQLETVVDVLTRLATTDYLSSKTGFRHLVMASGWPEEWKTRLTGWEDVAWTDASAFVNYMVAKNSFPAGHDLAGKSVLGEFLRSLLNKEVLGGEDADKIARILVECELVLDADALKKYYL